MAPWSVGVEATCTDGAAYIHIIITIVSIVK